MSSRKIGLAFLSLTLSLHVGVESARASAPEKGDKVQEVSTNVAPAFPPQGLMPRDFDGNFNDVNKHFTPLPVPSGAKIRGLILSGHARLTKVACVGSTSVTGKTIQWREKYVLSDGCSMITAEDKCLLVKTGNTRIYLKKGTTAVVHYDSVQNITRCTNLTDHHRGSMLVFFGKHYQEVDPGRELALIPDTGQNIEIQSIQERLAFRDLYRTRLDGMYLFVFKISAKDMVKRCKIYRQLNESPLEADHYLSREIVKSVAALDVMSNRKLGPFYLAPKYSYAQEVKQEKSQEEIAGANSVSK